jgi:hypothetical protein
VAGTVSLAEQAGQKKVRVGEAINFGQPNKEAKFRQ